MLQVSIIFENKRIFAVLSVTVFYFPFYILFLPAAFPLSSITKI